MSLNSPLNFLNDSLSTSPNYADLFYLFGYLLPRHPSLGMCIRSFVARNPLERTGSRNRISKHYTCDPAWAVCGRLSERERLKSSKSQACECTGGS